MTGMDDAFCSSTRPRRSMHRARADRVGHRAPEASYWASSRPIVGLSKRQSTCSRDLYHPHGPSGWSSWLRRGRPMRLARGSPNFREEFLSETQRTRGHEESRGLIRPGSLLSGHADGFGVAPPPLSQRSARTDVGPSVCFLSRSFTFQPMSRTWSYATAVASISIRIFLLIIPRPPRSVLV